MGLRQATGLLEDLLKVGKSYNDLPKEALEAFQEWDAKCLQFDKETPPWIELTTSVKHALNKDAQYHYIDSARCGFPINLIRPKKGDDLALKTLLPFMTHTRFYELNYGKKGGELL
jgi:hypothetical protein